MIKIIAQTGMVNIDNEKIAYSNIRYMYNGNRNGAGLQIDGELNNKIDEINECCDLIAKNIYKIQDLLMPSQSYPGASRKQTTKPYYNRAPVERTVIHWRYWYDVQN